MEEKMTMEITNDRLEEAIKEYAADRTKENLTTVLNLLRPTKLFVPAMLQAPDRPIPCFLKNSNEEQFLVVYTSKAQIPEEPKINPFSDNLVLKTELVQKLHEVDEQAAKRAAQMKQVKMTPAQFQVFVKRQVEFAVLPKRLFTEKQEFINKLCDEKEAFVNEIFAGVFKEPKLNPYTENDYSVMALDIAEDLTLIRVDLPEKGLVPPLCYRIYLTINPKTGKAGYYTIEMSKEKDVRMLGELLEDGKHIDHGVAPVEGAELQKIMDLARGEGAEVTS